MKLSETETILAPSVLDIFDVYVLMLRFSEKATKFHEISILVLTLLSSNVKNKVEIPVNFVALSEYLNFIIDDT